MSTISRRSSAVNDGGSLDRRIARVLEQAELAEVVPHLPPETLHQLVRHRGLGDSGELLIAATPAQLVALADLDLWQRPSPGRDERFDAARFGAWIEALVDVGADDAARTVAALDPSIAIAGLSRYVRVLDVGIFEPVAHSDDEAPARHDAMREGDAIGVDVDDRHDGRWEYEIAGYVVRARRREAWDGILTLLSALHHRHEPAFHRLMRGCRALSCSRPEIDGLDDLLMAPEQAAFELDVAREGRRSAQGFATPADARAFLHMARRGPSAGPNPIAAAYLRMADDEAPATGMPDSGLSPSAAATVAALSALLQEAEACVAPARARLTADGSAPPDAASPTLARLMNGVRAADVAAFQARTRELAFLGNVLAVGGSVQGRAFTPAEASRAAAGACNLGLEAVADLPDSWLVHHTLVAAFEEGWSRLHRDVGLFAAARLVDVLVDLHCDDPWIQDDLRALRQTLVRHHDAGTPWLARDRVDVLAMLDPVAAVALQGLLGECPVVASALGALVDGATAAVDPQAFEVVTTPAQIGEIRLFLRMLPVLLTR